MLLLFRMNQDMENSFLAKWLIVVGLGVFTVGLIILIFNKIGINLGRLPDDLHFQNVHFPREVIANVALFGKIDDFVGQFKSCKEYHLLPILLSPRHIQKRIGSNPPLAKQESEPIGWLV